VGSESQPDCDYRRHADGNQKVYDLWSFLEGAGGGDLGNGSQQHSRHFLIPLPCSYSVLSFAPLRHHEVEQGGASGALNALLICATTTP